LAGEILDGLGDDRVEAGVRECRGGRRAERPELERVAREGEWAGAGAVGCAGTTGVQKPRSEPCLEGWTLPASIAVKTFSRSVPRKIEMIAGGASLAPSRWSCPALAIDARSSSWWVFTAWMTAVQKNRNE